LDALLLPNQTNSIKTLKDLSTVKLTERRKLNRTNYTVITWKAQLERIMADVTDIV